MGGGGGGWRRERGAPLGTHVVHDEGIIAVA